MGTEGLGNPFHAWLLLQRQLQVDAFSYDPALLAGDDRAQFATWNAYALVDELSEAMQEVGWKPWAKSRHLNREEFMGEMVDLLHFAGNLLLMCAPVLAGEFITREGDHVDTFTDVAVLADELWDMYRSKVQENLRRQVEGYDGVKEKCPICKRELPCAEHPSA